MREWLKKTKEGERQKKIARRRRYYNAWSDRRSL